jgi:hypothetical protein
MALQSNYSTVSYVYREMYMSNKILQCQSRKKIPPLTYSHLKHADELFYFVIYLIP